MIEEVSFPVGNVAAFISFLICLAILAAKRAATLDNRFWRSLVVLEEKAARDRRSMDSVSINDDSKESTHIQKIIGLLSLTTKRQTSHPLPHFAIDLMW